MRSLRNLQIFLDEGCNYIQGVCPAPEKDLEVYAVQHQPAENRLKKVGFYRLRSSAFNEELWRTMQKYGASICSFGEVSIVITKTGSDIDLQGLYNLLEGPELLGFCKSALIADDAPLSNEDFDQL
jgi:hypothetical protein